MKLRKRKCQLQNQKNKKEVFAVTTWKTIIVYNLVYKSQQGTMNIEQHTNSQRNFDHKEHNNTKHLTLYNEKNTSWSNNITTQMTILSQEYGDTCFQCYFQTPLEQLLLYSHNIYTNNYWIIQIKHQFTSCIFTIFTCIKPNIAIFFQIIVLFV